MTAAREIRAARHHWVKLKHPSLLKEKEGGEKQALARSYHRKSFAPFAIGTSLALSNPFSTLFPSVMRSNTNAPKLKGARRMEYCFVTHNIMVPIFFFIWWIIQGFGFFSALWYKHTPFCSVDCSGVPTIGVTQSYVPSPTLSGFSGQPWTTGSCWQPDCKLTTFANSVDTWGKLQDSQIHAEKLIQEKEKSFANSKSSV